MGNSEYNRAYYLENREKLKADTRRYRQTNAEKIKASEERIRAENPKHLWLRRAKADAKKRAAEKGVPYDLDVTTLSFPDECPVFKTPLVYGGRVRSNASASLDRVVPALGYVNSNVRVISWRANCLKRDASVSELLSVANYMKGLGL